MIFIVLERYIKKIQILMRGVKKKSKVRKQKGRREFTGKNS